MKFFSFFIKIIQVINIYCKKNKKKIMINNTIQNKNLQKNQHEFLIFNKLKKLSISSSPKFPISPFLSKNFLESNGPTPVVQNFQLVRSKNQGFWTNSRILERNGKVSKKTKVLVQKNQSFFGKERKGPIENFRTDQFKNYGQLNNSKHSVLIKKNSGFFGKNKEKWLNYLFYKNPINLLFSIDQLLFEFAKKQPQRRKSSEFQQQLKERKKLTLFYGHLSKKQLTNLISQSKSYQGYFSKNFFSILERRLDVVLYRSGLVKNIISARQLISHKKILVNNKILNISSYQVNPGDIISIKTNKKNEIMSPLSDIIKTNFKKHGFRFPISQNFVYKLENRKNFKNYKQKKTLKNIIRFLLTKLDKRAFLKINKSCFSFLQTIPFLSKKTDVFLDQNTSFFEPTKVVQNLQLVQNSRILERNGTALNPKIFNTEKNFTLLKFKPLLSKQAKSFLLMCLQKNYLSINRKPLFQNKATRFLNILEKCVFFNKKMDVKNQKKKNLLFNERYTDKSKNNTPSFSKKKTQANFIKSFTRKLTNSSCSYPLESVSIFSKKTEVFVQKNKCFGPKKHLFFWKGTDKRKFSKISSYSKNQSWSKKTDVLVQKNQSFFGKERKATEKTNSPLFSRKRIIAIYRNVVYKTLLQMYSSFLYSLCFNSILQIKKKSNVKKNRINRLLTLKLKKHITKKHSHKQIKRALRFCVIKPMHLEVSYKISTAILLYSPQRLSFPFYIDVDLILRSFR